MFDGIEIAPQAPGAGDQTLLAPHQSRNWRAFLMGAVLAKKNILVSGSTGSGKTTFSKDQEEASRRAQLIGERVLEPTDDRTAA